MTTQKQTKEELLVENAILKNNENTRKMLKEELAPFTQTIKELENRVNEIENAVGNIFDTIEPFSRLRNKIWFIIIAGSLALGAAGDTISNWLHNLNK